jgi:hypothetical protein
VTANSKPTHQLERNTATGSMASSAMKLLAPGIGHVGTEPPLNNSASVVSYTTNALILATGPRTLRVAKNIVSVVVSS